MTGMGYGGCGEDVGTDYRVKHENGEQALTGDHAAVDGDDCAGYEGSLV